LSKVCFRFLNSALHDGIYKIFPNTTDACSAELRGSSGMDAPGPDEKPRNGWEADELEFDLIQKSGQVPLATSTQVKAQQ
ncbi:MAG: hypothetical protein K2X81_06825, partial [Candidatus Obscuribacterales bacterium]|nr:hypothetical protein [Candidatus Obscuribacterales bacterium]